MLCSSVPLCFDLPTAQHDRCFYRDFDDLVVRLTQLCCDVETSRREKLSSLVARYDWRVMAARYDDLFAGLLG